jgi:hypothetical protein
MSRKFFAPLVVALAVAGGGVAGAVIAVPALSGADEPTTQSPSTSSSATPAPSTARVRPGVFAAAADALGMNLKDLAKEMRSGKTIAQIAQEKNVDVNKVIDAMVAKATANGRDATKARDAITKLVNDGVKDNLRFRHPRLRRAAKTELDAAAKAIGIPTSELVQDLKDGKTIAQVAHDKGVDVNKVIDAMVAPARERITKFVNEGGPRHRNAATTPTTGTN